MLPQLLNIIGGTNVRAFSRSSFATGHARSPDPSTTPMLPSISRRWSQKSKPFDDSAEKMSAGESTFIDSRLTTVMSGFARRPQSQPSAITAKTGTMIPSSRSSIGQGGYRMYFARLSSPATPASRASTYAASIAIVSRSCVDAAYEISSSRRSITV
jgi:hypothetical protein